MKKRGLFFLTAAVLGCSLGLATGVMAATGTAMGMKDQITVEVGLDGQTITDVTVTSCGDTNVIKDAAIESVPARIVEQQNVDVDVVAGATMTSFGIRNAVKDALKNAGLDPADYSKGSDAVAEKAQGEDVECDIVIVGGGISGMSAALQAKRDGVERVLLLEKEGYTGGSSLVCGGGIWVMNTPFNEEISVNSTLEEFIGFLKTRSEGKELNEALLTQVYEVAGDVGTFLMENGLPFSKETWSLGHPDSKLPVIWSVHNEEAPWESGESGYFESVARMAADHGVEVRLNSKVTALAHDGQTVTGVLVEDQQSTYTVHAGKVILATGGFTRNRDLVAEYAPDFTNAFPMTGAGSNGEGIAMAKELGASMTGEGMMGLMGTNMNYGYYGPIGNLVWHPQIIVNKEGQTFGMDSTFYSETLALLLEQTDSQGYGIFDATTDMSERLEKAIEVGVAKKFASLEELAADYGIDEEALAATAKESSLAEGETYYCVPIKPLFIGSIPGLQVDENCHILDADGEPIENLLGAGELIFGNLFQVRYPASGTGMGLSTYTGALAARTAASELAQD